MIQISVPTMQVPRPESILIECLCGHDCRSASEAAAASAKAVFAPQPRADTRPPSRSGAPRPGAAYLGLPFPLRPRHVIGQLRHQFFLLAGVSLRSCEQLFQFRRSHLRLHRHEPSGHATVWTPALTHKPSYLTRTAQSEPPATISAARYRVIHGQMRTVPPWHAR